MNCAACCDVVPELLVELGWQRRLVETGAEVHEPAVAGLDRDLERRVTHAQARVAALLGVGRRTAPVLLEEHPEPLVGGSEVLLGIERPKHLVGRDTVVERVDDQLDRVVPADGVVEGLLAHASGSRRGLEGRRDADAGGVEAGLDALTHGTGDLPLLAAARS